MNATKMLALTLMCLLLAGCGMPKGSYTTAKAQVLKVYSVIDEGYSFVAYVVNHGGTEVVVSDQMGKSSYKVGDTIEYMVQKFYVGEDMQTLSFTLLDFE